MPLLYDAAGGESESNLHLPLVMYDDSMALLRVAVVAVGFGCWMGKYFGGTSEIRSIRDMFLVYRHLQVVY